MQKENTEVTTIVTVGGSYHIQGWGDKSKTGLSEPGSLQEPPCGGGTQASEKGMLPAGPGISEGPDSAWYRTKQDRKLGPMLLLIK